MDNLNAIIATNLKQYRLEKKLSLDKMAEVTGVSKSMIGQIEREISTPTLSTLMKLAKGLKLSLNDLLAQPIPDYKIIRKEAVLSIDLTAHPTSLYTYFPFNSRHRLEIQVLEVGNNQKLTSEALEPGVEKYLMLYKGCLMLRLNDQEIILDQGDAITFKADQPHTYLNLGHKTAEAHIITCYHHT